MEQRKEESFLFKNYDSMTLNNYILLKPSTLQPVFALFVSSSIICFFFHLCLHLFSEYQVSTIYQTLF